MSPATMRAYRSDWQHFSAWCLEAGLEPIPAEPSTVGAYLASLGPTHASTTIRRRLAAIGQMHCDNGFPWETGSLETRATLNGMLAEHGEPVRQAAAIRLADLRKLVDTCDDGPIGRRDRAVLLLGFAGAFRRSELVALEVTDVVATPFGLRVRIRRSKTDQERQGAGFITEAYDKGVRDQDIMDHTRHRDHKTMRGYVRRVRLLSESPAGKVGL